MKALIPDDAPVPPPATVNEMIDGIEAKAFLLRGRPAMAVILRYRNPLKPWITFPYPVVLVEGEDGRALAGTLPTYRWEQDTLEYAGVDGRERIPLVMSWLDGEAAWSILCKAHEDTQFRKALEKGAPRAAARIAQVVSETFPGAGFSETFIEAIRCVQPWVNGLGSAIDFLFDRDAPGRNARDFVRRYPLLSSLQLPRVGFRARSGPVALADIFPALDPKLAAALELPAWRRAETALVQAVAYDARPRLFLKFASSIPIEWIRPTGRPQAIGFLRAYILSRTLVRLGADPATLLRASRGDWVAFHRRCKDAAGKTRLLDKYEHPGNEAYLIDPLSDFANRVVLPVVSLTRTLASPKRDAADTVALRILYREKSLPGCYEAARRWHDRLAAINAEMPDESDTSLTIWQPLFEETTVAGILLKPLVSAREIEDEGAKGRDADGVLGLDHCVASYRSKARHATSHIVSLRRIKGDGTFVRLATAELSQDAKGKLRLVQLQGRANTTPSLAARAAMEAFLIATPRLPVVVPSLTAYEDDVRELCGYDYRDTENVRRACLAYGTMLPRGLRSDPDALAAAILQEWIAVYKPDDRVAD